MNQGLSDYLDTIKDDHQHSLILHAHEKILALIPDIRFSIKWKIPFYYYLAPLCYINCHKDHIYVSFYYGKELTDHPKLIKENLKLVAKYFITSSEEIEDESFTILLMDAALLNEQKKRK
jgi:hypothetical protein